MEKENLSTHQEAGNHTPTANEQSLQDINQVLENLPSEQREVIMSAFISLEERSSYYGILPAPEDFKAYGAIVKNAPERILAMAELQQKHRIEAETNIINYGIKESIRGQWMGFVLVLVFICIAAFLGYHGHDTLAGVIVTLIVAVAIIFVLKKNPKEDKKEKSTHTSVNKG